VLSCIYSVFTEGYWSTAGPSAIRDDLCDEGVRLSGEICTLDARRTGGAGAGSACAAA
jgi:RNA polymerase sigma-70 factor (ECF subfamily)